MTAFASATGAYSACASRDVGRDYRYCALGGIRFGVGFLHYDAAKPKALTGAPSPCALASYGARRGYVLRWDMKDHALDHNNRRRNCTEQPR